MDTHSKRTRSDGSDDERPRHKKGKKDTGLEGSLKHLSKRKVVSPDGTDNDSGRSGTPTKHFFGERHPDEEDVAAAAAVDLGRDDATPMAPVVHPQEDEKEAILGPKVPADSVCYLCHRIDRMDRAKISEKITSLRDAIAEGRANSGDRIALARQIQHKFETEIRGPVNARIAMRSEAPDDEDEEGGCSTDREAISEWTLRSVYDHICKHDPSPEALLDMEISYLTQMQETLFKNGLYKSKPGSKVSLDVQASAVMLATNRQLMSCIKQRIALGGNSSAPRGSSSTAVVAAPGRRPALKKGSGGSSIDAVASGASKSAPSGRTRALWMI
jgi:hypothetical protein